MSRYMGPVASNNIVGVGYQFRFTDKVLDELACEARVLPVHVDMGREQFGHTISFYREGDLVFCIFELTRKSPNLVAGLRLMKYHVVPKFVIQNSYMEHNIDIVNGIRLIGVNLTMFPSDESLSFVENVSYNFRGVSNA